MNAAWRARKGDPEARRERRDHLRCRVPGCRLNRRRHAVHFGPRGPFIDAHRVK